MRCTGSDDEKRRQRRDTLPLRKPECHAFNVASVNAVHLLAFFFVLRSYHLKCAPNQSIWRCARCRWVWRRPAESRKNHPVPAIGSRVRRAHVRRISWGMRGLLDHKGVSPVLRYTLPSNRKTSRRGSSPAQPTTSRSAYPRVLVLRTPMPSSGWTISRSCRYPSGVL